MNWFCSEHTEPFLSLLQIMAMFLFIYFILLCVVV